MRRSLRYAAAFVLGAALAASLAVGSLAAQSVLASRGLGYPIDPVDARSRGLGGVSVGLADPGFSLVNPAAPAGLAAPGFSATFQPDAYDATAGDLATDGTTARFPLLQLAFPVRGGLTGFVGYGAYLDQHWKVEQADSIDLPTGRVGVIDRVVSAGAVARLRAGAAYRLSDRLAVGAAADVITGAVRDSATRSIGEGMFGSFSGVTYRYRGVGAAAGVRWTPSGALSVAAAVTGGGQITAEAAEDSVGGEREKSYPRPLEVDAGASAHVTQNLLLAVSGRWSGWSAADAELAGSGGARDAVTGSLGVEYEGVSLFGRPAPLRLGARYTQLPFRWGSVADGNEFPNEQALSAGAGVRLGAARLDAAAERGRRGGDAAGFEEPFWRFSFTVSVLGR
ncbi:MAG TPA: hypothetical protein VEW03_15335 [Longimicrobiaceae bacterium]|nr:hypothetical protein [Longimicrobiaceae bacterium]